MIDLTKFCSNDPFRPALGTPWSRDGYTFAINGVVVIRVAERPDVPDQEGLPNLDLMQKEFQRICAFRPWRFVLPLPPAATQEKCDACYGRGTEHDCPDCECECEYCEGRGVIKKSPEEQERRISASYAGVLYALGHIRLIASLPDLEIETAPRPDAATRFTFAGGDGLLMPLSHPYDTHLGDLEEAAE